MSDRGLEQAFERGRTAEEAGRSVRDNPYMPHTEASYSDAWLAGFTESEGPAYVARRLDTTPNPS